MSQFTRGLKEIQQNRKNCERTSQQIRLKRQQLQKTGHRINEKTVLVRQN